MRLSGYRPLPSSTEPEPLDGPSVVETSSTRLEAEPTVTPVRTVERARAGQPERPDGVAAGASLLGALAGRMRPLAATACLGAALLGAPALGQSLPDAAAIPEPTPVVQTVEAAETSHPRDVRVFTKDPKRYDALVGQLDRLREDGRATAAEVAKARQVLWRVLIEGHDDPVPRTADGRIDVLALATGRSFTDGERILKDLASTLEKRMRMDARGLALGEKPLEGHPGYRELPLAQVTQLIVDALERMPIGELPAGDTIIELVSNLPGAEGLDLANLSTKELLDALGDHQEDWLRSKVEPLIEGREVEAGLLAFAAMTGVRMGSEDAAKLIDGLNPRVTVYRESWNLGEADAQVRVRASYRDQEVFPNLDLTGSVRAPLGSGWTARGDLEGRVSTVTGNWTLTGTTGIGYQDGSTYAEATARGSAGSGAEPSFALTTRAGWSGLEPQLTVGAKAWWKTPPNDASASFDEGHWGVEIEATRPITAFGGEGEWGAYVGQRHAPGTDADNFVAGLVLRVSF